MRKKHLTVGAIFMLVVLTAVVTSIVSFYTSALYYNEKFGDLHALEQKYLKLKEITDVIDKHFIADYDYDTAMDSAMAGFVEGLGDKWSDYYTAEQTKLINEASENAYVGIGVTLSSEANTPFMIIKVAAEGPAAKAGILPFDTITHVDGTSVEDVSQEELVSMVRGAEGSGVSLTVQRGADSLTFDMKRAPVYYEQVEAYMLEGDVGYISVAGFNNHVDDEFIEKLNQLLHEGARGLVLDVRMNGGGRVDVMSNMLDLLLPEGIIISLVDIEGTTWPYMSDSEALLMPMAVLINEYSISAAEFFAAALQEYGVATVVGTQTGGKGYAQQTFDLYDGSSLNLSVMRYYTPKGNSLIDVGVIPDIDIDLSEEDLYNYALLTDEEDDQLQAALQEVLRQLPQLPAEEELPQGEGEAETTAAAD